MNVTLVQSKDKRTVQEQEHTDHSLGTGKILRPLGPGIRRLFYKSRKPVKYLIKKPKDSFTTKTVISKKLLTERLQE